MEPLISGPLEAYAAAHTTAPGALLDELEAYTQAHCANPQMLTGRLEGQLLAMLVATTGAKRVLEVGCYTGYSALSMASTLPADGTLLTLDRNPDTAKVAQSFFERSPVGSKITLRLGEALDTLRGLPAEMTFDLVFLDADKENYINYYELILPKLRRGGLLVADNVLWSGRVLKPEKETDKAIVAFNRHVADDPRVEQVMLSVRDGVLMIRKLRD